MADVTLVHLPVPCARRTVYMFVVNIDEANIQRCGKIQAATTS
jgi:hypothetical protein